MLSAGIELLGATHGAKSGTLTQGETSLAFTGALVTRRVRRGAGGDRDAERIEVQIPASGISGRPQVESHVAFTGEDGGWLVAEVSPITAGDSTVAWRLSLVTWTQREDETGEGE